MPSFSLKNSNEAEISETNNLLAVPFKKISVFVREAIDYYPNLMSFSSIRVAA